MTPYKHGKVTMFLMGRMLRELRSVWERKAA